VTGGRRVVYLDRDGVFVVPDVRDGKGYAIWRLEHLEFYPDDRAAVARLREAGFEVVMVTNQPDDSAGLIDAAVLQEIFAKVSATLGVARIHTCPHAAGTG
jgi:D-glycero-D-manno-heptose 1,7-bisphosphate phosphatase